MKIAHISDLHLTTFFKQNTYNAIEHTLRYILEQGTDHIAITGDLTDNAGQEDFMLLRGLFKKYDLLDPEKLTIVIGNHDIFGGVQTAEDIFSFPERCGTVDYQRKVILFHNYFRETYEGCEYISEDNLYPFSKVIDGVLFTGINSIGEYSKLQNPFASNGKIKLEQFIEVSEILEKHKNNNLAKIILIHHHFNKMASSYDSNPGSLWGNIEKQTMKLKKKKRLLQLFNLYKVDLVLHGHYHQMNEYYRKGVRFLNAGASFKSNRQEGININFIDINGREINTCMHNINAEMEPVINYFDKMPDTAGHPYEDEKMLNVLAD